MEGEEMAAKARTEGHAIDMYLSPRDRPQQCSRLGPYDIVSLWPWTFHFNKIE
jgi:hypothetical protein